MGTEGKIVNRCDHRRLVTPDEDLSQCRDANEEGVTPYNGGCDQNDPPALNEVIPEDDSMCWEVQKFGEPGEGEEEGPEDEQDEDEPEDEQPEDEEDEDQEEEGPEDEQPEDEPEDEQPEDEEEDEDQEEEGPEDEDEEDQEERS